MRGIITLLVCLLSFWQAQATTYTCSSTTNFLKSQSEHHSKPINQQQENQEENELTDEDEDFSDETLYSLEYDLPPTLFYKNILIEIYLMNEASAHVNPILTPPDRMP
jgi:hypothetical protein